MDKRFDVLDEKVDLLGVRVGRLEEAMATTNERLGRIERHVGLNGAAAPKRKAPARRKPAKRR